MKFNRNKNDKADAQFIWNYADDQNVDSINPQHSCLSKATFKTSHYRASSYNNAITHPFDSSGDR